MRYRWRHRALMGLALLSLATLSRRASGQDIISLLDLELERRLKTVREFIETKAAAAPLADVVGLFDPDLALGPNELEALYFVLAPRMKREELPLLSTQAKNMQPGVAAPALRLVGRSANKDAFDILSERLEDKEPEVILAAAEGLGCLQDRRAIPVLTPLAARLPSAPPAGKVWDAGRRIPVSAGLALAHLGEWSRFLDALNELGGANESRLGCTWHACRTTYNSPEQCRMSLKHVLMLKRWFRFVVPSLEALCRKDPSRFAAAVARCQQPFALDMAYNVVHEVLDKENAVAMLPLLNCISNEVKSLYLDLAEPFLDEPTKQKVRDGIRSHAKQSENLRARLFAIAYAHWLPKPEGDALLEAMAKDENPWVRHEAAARRPVEDVNRD